MKKALMFLTGIAFTLLLLPDISAQQDYTQPKKYENVKWYHVNFVKFNPGMAEMGMEIAEKHFASVDQQLGTAGPEVYRFLTGEWDLILYFPLEEGPGSLAWQNSPEHAEWTKTFFEREGGPEKGMEIFMKFGETVAKEKWDLAMRPME